MHKKWHVFIAKIIIGENRLRFVVVFNFHGAWHPPYTRHSRASLTGKQYILCSCYPPRAQTIGPMHTEWCHDGVIHGAEIIYPSYTHINSMEKLEVQIVILVDIFEILVHKVPNFWM
jgi:hypothetical protein